MQNFYGRYLILLRRGMWRRLTKLKHWKTIGSFLAAVASLVVIIAFLTGKTSFPEILCWIVECKGKTFNDKLFGGKSPSLIGDRPIGKPDTRPFFDTAPKSVGSLFKDCPVCPELRVVPAGTYMMGSPNSDPNREPHEQPQHVVRLSKPFALGKYEVSFSEWDACVADGGCNKHIPDDAGWGRARMPVVNVSWNDAQSYIQWIRKITGKNYRLPSESEWEYAARGGISSKYFFGEEARGICKYGNISDLKAARIHPSWRKTDCADGHIYTTQVGSYKSNPYGIYDTIGNVWEWVEDCYHESYWSAPTDGTAWKSGFCDIRVLRGGSFDNPAVVARSSNRDRAGIEERVNTVGFRVARDLESNGN